MALLSFVLQAAPETGCTGLRRGVVGIIRTEEVSDISFLKGLSTRIILSQDIGH